MDHTHSTRSVYDWQKLIIFFMSKHSWFGTGLTTSDPMTCHNNVIFSSWPCIISWNKPPTVPYLANSDNGVQLVFGSGIWRVITFDAHMSNFFSPRYLMRDDQGQGLMRHLTGFWISRSPGSQVHLVSALFDLLRWRGKSSDNSVLFLHSIPI